MHDEGVTPASAQACDQRAQRNFRILLVDTDAAFDGDGHRRGRAASRRRSRATSTGSRIRQAPKAARLHAVGGAADIEIDLVIAYVPADARRLRPVAPAPSRPAAAPRDVPPHRSPEAARDRPADQASAVTISV